MQHMRTAGSTVLHHQGVGQFLMSSINCCVSENVAAMQTEKQLLKYHLRSRSFIALKTAFLVFSFEATICCRESILF